MKAIGEMDEGTQIIRKLRRICSVAFSLIVTL